MATTELRVLEDPRPATRPGKLGPGFDAVELADDVEDGDEADEAEAHDEDDGGADLQARRVVRVEAKHIAAGPAASKAGRADGGRGATQPPSTHPGGGGGGATGGDEAGA